MLGELPPLRRLDLPGLGQQGGVAEHPGRVAQRGLGRGPHQLPARVGGVDGGRGADHPVVEGDGDEPADHEHAGVERLEGVLAQVGVGGVGELVDQVVQDERGTRDGADLEDALDDVLPTEHHRPLGLVQLGPLGQEPVDQQVAARQAVLQREVVEGQRGGRLVRDDPVGEESAVHQAELPGEPA
ncbi:hypothetical protein [Nonomuraea dietziae]|uniref:hypothetical protein n=1 Tax=Nonomuraea dietziae TaxID=65515 RepID=UPI0031D60808